MLKRPDIGQTDTPSWVHSRTTKKREKNNKEPKQSIENPPADHKIIAGWRTIPRPQTGLEAFLISLRLRLWPASPPQPEP